MSPDMFPSVGSAYPKDQKHVREWCGSPKWAAVPSIQGPTCCPGQNSVTPYNFRSLSKTVIQQWDCTGYECSEFLSTYVIFPINILFIADQIIFLKHGPHHALPSLKLIAAYGTVEGEGPPDPGTKPPPPARPTRNGPGPAFLPDLSGSLLP